jgi:glycosyltransferase involved in cell wall biosynthesis
VPSSRLRLAPLGVDLALFKPGPKAPANAPRLVHIATLTPVKDQTTLLYAFRQLHERLSEVTLDIVGEGPLKRELERLVSQLKLSDVVRFQGAVDHAALPQIYQAGSAFVLSSRHEAQGMVAIEAAACGVPVAGTRVGVLPELALSTAAMVPVGAVEALAVGMATALEATDHRAQHSLELARRKFALAHCTDTFRDLYANLAPP